MKLFNMRKKIIIGNWKMNLDFESSNYLIQEIISKSGNINVVFCFGEKLEDRKSNNYLKIISKQLKDSLFNLDVNLWNKIILAYEPVWAIGTGETATPEQAQEIHSFVRNLISENYSKTLSEKISILYGGSVKPNNAQSIFSQKDVDGGLIGGASLDSNHFKF